MRVTAEGQVTIPANIRAILGITRESKIHFVEDGGRVYIAKVDASDNKNDLCRFRGIATTGMSTDEILSLTREP